MSELAKKIEMVLNSQVRPMIQSHGGDIDFVSYDEEGGLVKVELKGVCSGCPGAAATISNFVQVKLQEWVPDVRQVVPV